MSRPELDGEWPTLERFAKDARVWAQQIVDLRAFAGKSVELGFRLVGDESVVKGQPRAPLRDRRAFLSGSAGGRGRCSPE